jgi:hypothetical protein
MCTWTWWVAQDCGPHTRPGQCPVGQLLPFLTARCEERLAQVYERAQTLVEDVNQTVRRERAVLHSLVEFTGGVADADTDGAKALTDQAAIFNAWIDAAGRRRGAKGTAASAPWASSADARRVPVRIGEFGPLTYQNDNVLLARLGKERYSKIKLINSEATPLLAARDQSELYAYEITNFVDGKRTVGEIRDAVSAEYGPLPVSLVVDYLDACAEAGIIQWR